MKPLVAVDAKEDSLEMRKLALAKTLALPLVSALQQEACYHLLLTPERLELLKVGSKMKPVFVDFVSARSIYRQRGLSKEPLAKAVGLTAAFHPTVIDATAGMGQDAFILANLGCEVTMLERSPVVAALLQDGLDRAGQNPAVEQVMTRLELIHTDAKSYLLNLAKENYPEVIYLDPMYPESGKSAAKRKAMQFLRDMLGDDDDAQELLELARHVVKKRVVVKRPIKAASLGNAKPDAVISGRTTRFDLYV